MPLLLPVNDESIARASALLRAGKLVAFPTETVYGLGADASNGQAVASLYAAKGRPSFNPLIVHVFSAGALDELVEWNDAAKELAKKFWPGPMTLVLRRKQAAPVSLLVSAGQDTLAVRIPAHPHALKLLKSVDLPIAAPSANASGRISPTTPQHVADSLGEAVDLILDGGRSPIGIESTVISLVDPCPVILRPGAVTHEQLKEALNEKVGFASSGSQEMPTSPGLLASHYAPALPVRLNVEIPDPTEAFLGFGPHARTAGAAFLNLSKKGSLNEAAANLFAMLRALDKPDYSCIAVAPIPDAGLGAAINDRLRRAAAERNVHVSG